MPHKMTEVLIHVILYFFSTSSCSVLSKNWRKNGRISGTGSSRPTSNDRVLVLFLNSFLPKPKSKYGTQWQEPASLAQKNHSVLQSVAVWFSVFQCVAMCCSVLQSVAVCRSLCKRNYCGLFLAGLLQCAAVCCGVLQCVAACCSVLQRVAASCSVFQCDSGAGMS